LDPTYSCSDENKLVNGGKDVSSTMGGGNCIKEYAIPRT
jgi:hypothetical protein